MGFGGSRGQYGIRVKPVPFSGDSEAVTALRGGNACFDPTGEVVLSIQGRRLPGARRRTGGRVDYLPDRLGSSATRTSP